MTEWVLAVFLFLIAIEIYIVCHFVRTKNSALLKTTLTPIILFGLYVTAVFIFRLRISSYIMLLAIIAQFIFVFFGYYLKLFERSKTFDRYVHAYSSFSYSLLAYSTLSNLIDMRASKVLTALFIVTLGISLGVFTEIAEFLSDKRKKLGANLQKGLVDTNFDLIFDSLGSLAAGVFAYFVML